MKPIKEQIDELCRMGYRDDAARAKVAHDIVLLGMHRCGFKPFSTIKGGVVMSSLTDDIRRATMDMDIDFIRYSIGAASVERFVRRIARAMDEVEIKIIGTPIDLKHADYRGRRIYLSIRDGSIARAIRTKVDIGVHANEALAQMDFSFRNNSGAGSADLQANSPEQIFAEKLLSLLRHGASSNRPKDIFDMYYLADKVKRRLLKEYVSMMVYSNPGCRVNGHEEMMRLVRLIFGFKSYAAKLTRSRANWLQLPADKVIDSLERFLEGLS